MNSPYTLLLVEDNPGDVLLIEEALHEVPGEGFRIAHAPCLSDALALMREQRFDAVLLDLALPDSTGLGTLAAVQTRAGGAPVLVLTGLDDERTALKAVHLGAHDYLVKGQVFGTMLGRSVRHAIERARTDQSLREAEERFRQLSEHVSSVYWLASADGSELLFVTPAVEALTGRTPEALYADPCAALQVVHPQDRPRILERKRNRPETWDDEYRLVRPDGKVCWVRDRGYRVAGPDGAVTRLTGVVEDITEARAAREQIRLQARLLDAVGEAVIATDLPGTVFYWNRAAEELYGWAAEEAVGRNIVDLLVPEMGRDEAEEIMERMRAGVTWRGEMVLRRRDGSTFPALVSDAPILDPDGRLLGIIGSSTDLSARRRAEQAVRDSEARYRALFETMAQGVVFFGPRGEVRSANPAALDILGLDAARVMGRTVRELGLRVVNDEGVPVPPPDPSLAAWRAASEQPLQRLLGVWNPREERVRWILVSARPHPAEGGEENGIFCTFTDITTQRETEDELRRAHRSLDAIVSTTPLATVVVDRGGTVRLWNPAAERMFGWTAGEVVGGPYPLEPAEGEPVPQAIFEDALDGIFWNGKEVRRRTKDGRVLDLNLWNAALKGPGGETVALVGVLADVSERKALEEQFLQAQKMEAVGRLAGGVAHDFNNMLTAITGHTELLLLDTEEGTEQHADLVEVRKAAVRAASLTRQLLAFSRKQVVQPQVLDLNAVVADTRRMLERLIGEDVELRVECNAGRAAVRADRGQLEQVLMNLAVNARDAMPRGGLLRIETDEVVITPEHALRAPDPVLPGAYVRLAVDDTGTGIPHDLLPRVFDPFFTTKEVGKGTGLGLSTVYGIVKQSGGYIWAESGVGVGSTFRVYLPLAGERPAPDAPPSRDGGEGGNETVLVVEDDTAVQALAARILTSRGYHVLRAPDGPAALEVLAGGEPVDVILTDVVLPRMSGPDLAARARDSGRPVPAVLFMSGYTDQALARHGVLEPGVELLEKPFSPEQLARRVRQLLDRTRAARAEAAAPIAQGIGNRE